MTQCGSGTLASVRLRFLTCVVLVGCGFRSQATGSAGAIPDDASLDGVAARDGAVDSPPSQGTGCWPHWYDHNPVLSTPARIDELSSTGPDRDPWLSEDGKRIYFAHQAPGGTSDIYFASRASTSVPFGTPAKIVELSTTTAQEGRPALSRDELTLVLSSDISNQFDVRISVRPDVVTPFGSPDTRMMGNVNTSMTQHYDPFLTGDGLNLYLAPKPNNPQNSPQHIYVASRAALGDNFGPPSKLPVVNSTGAGDGDADPSVSLDQRVLLFSSDRGNAGNDTDLYYATRAGATGNFSTPIALSAVNGAALEGDPMLSADGCDLYFASNRTSGDYDLYVSHVTP